MSGNHGPSALFHGKCTPCTPISYVYVSRHRCCYNNGIIFENVTIQSHCGANFIFVEIVTATSDYKYHNNNSNHQHCVQSKNHLLHINSSSSPSAFQMHSTQLLLTNKLNNCSFSLNARSCCAPVFPPI